MHSRSAIGNRLVLRGLQTPNSSGCCCCPKVEPILVLDRNTGASFLLKFFLISYVARITGTAPLLAACCKTLHLLGGVNVGQRATCCCRSAMVIDGTFTALTSTCLASAVLMFVYAGAAFTKIDQVAELQAREGGT